MEVLVFLLIGILFAIGSNKKKNGQQGGKPGMTRPPQPMRPAAPQQPVNTAAGRDFLKELMKAVEDTTETMLEGKPAPKPAVVPAAPVQPAASEVRPVAPVAKPAAPLYAQGGSLEDDEGCVGGSMAHAHTEGETRSEHRQHVERLQKREAEERQTEEALWDSVNLNRRRLRQAVVMAEVLGKPAALRQRRAGRYAG